jgi:hypothetical protein
MKKIILIISGLLLIGFFALRVVDAQKNTREIKKAAATAMNCSKCPSSAACEQMKDTKKTETKKCDPAKCKEMGCDPSKCKEAKCDSTMCKANCTSSKNEMKKCDPAKCSAMAKK